ncbi:MAG: alpha-2-macroglobulin [Deltaproteobacteria bacterium]|nr:alpha-2-macroglobulin [Deltaproteobacteria bacterium]
MKRVCLFSAVIGVVMLTSLSMACSPTHAQAGPPPTVERFSPEGYAAKVRQATVRFTEQMVPFGDPRISDPFEVSCAGGIAGRGRWADDKNWAYDFDEDLPAGVVCNFTLKPELKSLTGKYVAGQRNFSFTTGGPKIVQSHPREGSNRIDENQAFILLLSGEAAEESILRNVSFSVEGVNEAVGVSIVKGDDRKRLIESGPARGFIHILRPKAGRSTVLEFNRKKDIAEDPRIVVLAARRTFPPESKVFLRWGRGVRSVSGVATEETQSLPFQVRPPFTIKFSCDRENRDAGCIPLIPMTIRFSAPVAKKTAEKIVMHGGNGVVYKPYFRTDAGDEESFVHNVTFRGPFPEKSKFLIEIPSDLVDDAGRIPENRARFPLQVETNAYPPLAKFPGAFGIVELNADSAFPLTLRNIEAGAKSRILGVEEGKPDRIDGLEEKTLRKVIEYGEWINTFVPESLKKSGEKDIGLMKGKMFRLRMGLEGQILHWLQATGGENWEPWMKMKHSDQDFRGVSILAGQKDVQEFIVPKPGGEKAFEVVGIPFRKPGFYVIEIESANLGRSLVGLDEKMYVSAAVLVTNMAAHFKKGRESSLVWVTTLDKGEPVADAEVAVHDVASGKTVWQGKTDTQGTVLIRQTLPRSGPRSGFRNRPEFIVTARKGGDYTFVLSNWDRGIEPFRFGFHSMYAYDPSIAHTVFDRKLFRAGETVHMKHFMRRHSLDGLFNIEEKGLPKAVLIRHAGSQQRYEFPVSWARDGSAETEWNIPKEAKLGEYSISLLQREPGKKGTRTEVGGYREGDEDYAYLGRKERNTGSFRVEEFHVPLMKGTVHAPGGPEINAREIDLDLFVSYLSGGGAGGAPVKLRTVVQPKNVSFPDYGDFIFANGKVVEGISRDVPRYFYGEAEYWEDEDEAGAEKEIPPDRKPRVRTQELVLDAFGALRTKVSGLHRHPAPRNLIAELEYSDPNGEIQAVSARIPLWSSRILLGIKPDSWAASKDSFKFHVAALGLSGKPLKGTRVSVDMYQRKSYSHRKRLLGGMYAYDHIREVRRIGNICEGITDGKGLLICETKSPVSGNVILQASASDSDNNVSFAIRDVWVAGKEEWWFDVSNSDKMDVIPERKRYEPGETAVFQVRMPFREATALVTVEREGIAEVFLKKLSGKSPVIEVPIKQYHAPNVYVSVLCVRGRVAGAAPTATVDLGKPAFKLGMSEINVGWRAHEVKVDVSTDREAYRTRDKAKVSIRAKRVAGGALPKGTEIIVAAVDEGLLELSDNGSWKLLDAMMGRRPYELSTSTAQMQIVGKRHYGLKALPHGGGGGRQAAREFFDTLLYWKARVPLDENGEAQVEIPLNDSITSFRIVAVASGGAEFFGTGEATIRTTRELAIFSGLPPLVREDDRFRAGFTVRNSTEKKLEIRAEAKLSSGKGSESLAPVMLSLGPGQAREATWEVRVPIDAGTLRWEVSASAGEGIGDSIRVTQRVFSAVPVRAFQATLMQLAAPLGMKVRLPADAIPGRGGIDVALRSRLSEGMGGVIRFMREYFYTCLEQKVSRAVALRDSGLWKSVMADLPSYLDQDGLAKYFPLMPEGSDALTAYILSVASEAGGEVPEGSKRRMIEGLKGFIEGRVIRYGSLPTADLSIRKMAALDAISRYEEGEPSHLDSITVAPNLWPTSGVIDWLNVLHNIEEIPDREKRLAEAERILRARLNFQGTTMGFSTERSDYLWWLMVSGDVNAVRAVLALMESPGWSEDIPRMVRGALGRQHIGAWSTTVANAWGVLAMEKFSKKYEAEAVAGETRAELERVTRSLDWEKTPKGASMLLPWPKGEGTLQLSHRGKGRPWATVQSMASVPLKEPFSSGYTVKKTLAPVQQAAAGRWSRGDVVRVTLEIDAQADMTWVVVNDPIPAGGTILGSGLGRDSRLLIRKEKREGLAWPAFTERAFDAFRSYYEFVPKGKWTVEYTFRLNNGGTFLLPPTRVEALYAPEMFGEIPNRPFAVAP